MSNSRNQPQTSENLESSQMLSENFFDELSSSSYVSDEPFDVVDMNTFSSELIFDVPPLSAFSIDNEEELFIPDMSTNSSIHSNGFNPITEFSSDPTDQKGYALGKSVRLQLADIMNVKVDPLISLGQPIFVDHDHIVVGTNYPGSTEHYLICVKLSAITETGNPVVSIIRLSHRATDLKLLHTPNAMTHTILLAVDGDIQLVTINKYNFRFVDFTVTTPSLDLDKIREIAISPTDQSQLLVAGDNTLCIIDTETTDVLHRRNLNTTIGSVKWSDDIENCPSLTTDHGSFQIFDFRSGYDPIVSSHTGKSELYTHARPTSTSIMFGYGDGTLRQWDMRKTGPTSDIHVVDPYCAGIGSIEYNDDKTAFTVSGYADFSVWRHDKADNIAKVWSHSHLNKTRYSSRVICNSIFGENDQIVSTSSDGSVSVFFQGFY